MLSNFLSKTRPINYVTILLLLCIFFFLGVLAKENTTLNFAVFGKLILNFVALFFMVLLSNFVVRKNSLTKDNSFSLFLVVVFFVMLPQAMQWSVLFLSNIFLLISLRRVFSIKNNLRLSVKVFDAGFWLGIAVLLYSNLIVFWLVLVVGLMVYQKLNFKNLMISIVGTFVPIFLFYAYCLTFDKLDLFIQQIDIKIDNSIIAYGNLSVLIPLTLLISLLIWSILSVTAGINKISIKNRSSWFLVLFNLSMAALISFTSVDKNGSEFIYLFFPASIIIANYLQKEKDKWFRNLVLYVTFIVALGIYFL